VLTKESWWRGNARSELPTVRPKAATAALVGNGAPAAIGGQQGVDEHEQGTGKLVWGLMGAKGA
jgi:hypothetical protein